MPAEASPFANVPSANTTLAPVPDLSTDVPTEEAVDEAVAAVAAGDENEEWEHEVIEFAGDTLHVRKPTQQALAAFSLASSKYVPTNVRTDMTGLFMVRHLSPDSYNRVFERLMDPDDSDYTLETIGKLVGAITESGKSATTD